MSGFRCVSCREYYPGDYDGQVKVGLGRACSSECARNKQSSANRSRSEHAVASSQKPKLDRAPTARLKISSDIPPANRAQVMLRDGGKCRWCGVKNVEAHHINYKSEGIDHQPHNLILLCQRHHVAVHANKKHWKPVLRAYIWLTMVEGKTGGTIPQIEKALHRRRLIPTRLIRPERFAVDDQSSPT